METVTYEQISTTQIAVYLPGPGKRRKRVGHIFTRKLGTFRANAPKGTGYQYVPLGKKKGGEIFSTLQQCKYSLENEPPNDPEPSLEVKGHSLRRKLGMSEAQAVKIIAKDGRYYAHGVPLPDGRKGGMYAVEVDGVVFHANDTRELALRLQGRCCDRDTDGDGNCPDHSAPGVLRKPATFTGVLEAAQNRKRQ